MYVYDPFLTYIDLDASEQEVKHLLQRQSIIEAVLEGKEDPALALESIADTGIDVTEYIDEVERQVAAVILGGVPIEGGSLLLNLRGNYGLEFPRDPLAR